MIQKVAPKQPQLFESEFNAILHPKHKIKWLADAMDWSFFENAFGSFDSPKGRPAKP
ncbi:MAG: hypothetical protein OXC61_06625 [Flavobacteriaceae bacterium]|nr:hypothetical protein [Flavobacteriaceae bacterium]